MPELTLVDTEDLADELGQRGWISFHPDTQTSVLFNYIDDSDLAGEFDARGLHPHLSDYEDDEITEELELRGYSVGDKDHLTNLLLDLYYDKISLTPEQFNKVLKELFIREINRRL